MTIDDDETLLDESERMDDWNESDHPRDKDGKFGDGNGGGSGSEGAASNSNVQTVSLKGNTNAHHAEYHQAIANIERSRGNTALAEGHEKIAAKYEKKAARERRANPTSAKG